MGGPFLFWYAVLISDVVLRCNTSGLLLNIWEPLCSKRRPLKSCTEETIVEERRILLPRFVFLINQLLGHNLVLVLVGHVAYAFEFVCCLVTIDNLTITVLFIHPRDRDNLHGSAFSHRHEAVQLMVI